MAQVINYPATGSVPAGSFTLYTSLAETKAIAASGQTGIDELNTAHAATRRFIEAAEKFQLFGNNTAKNATNEQGKTAAQVASDRGIADKPRSWPGELLNKGGQIVDWIGRKYINPVFSTSKSAHDWDSTDADDILTGGGTGNERYDTLVRAAADSLAYINTALKEQKADAVQQNITNEEASTRRRLADEKYDHDRNIPGTAANFYSRLMNIFQPNVDEYIDDVAAALEDLATRTDRDVLIPEIKSIGKQVIDNLGTQRYRRDMTSPTPVSVKDTDEANDKGNVYV